jgi:hypothetical protein
LKWLALVNPAMALSESTKGRELLEQVSAYHNFIFHHPVALGYLVDLFSVYNATVSI